MITKLSPLCLLAHLCLAAGPYLGNGIKVSEVDQTSAVVWIRLTAEPTADFSRLPILTLGLTKRRAGHGSDAC
jgi:hypothetical protein